MLDGKQGKKLALRGSLLLDQISFSLTNFILTITIARSFQNSALAGYGVGLAVALSVSYAQRGTYIVPFALLHNSAARRVLPGKIAEHVLVLLLLFVILIPVLLIVYAFSSTDAGGLVQSIIVSSLLCGLLYFGVEFERMALIKAGHVWTPFFCTLAYTCVIGVTALFSHHMSYTAFAGILSAFCLLRSAFILRLVAKPHWAWGMRLLKRDFKIYAPSSALNALFVFGSNQLPLVILVATSDPAQAASLVAVRSLTQPLQIVIRSLDIVDKHSLRADSAERPGGIRAIFWRTFRFYGAISAAAILVLAIFAHPILRLAYGHKFQQFALLLPLWGAYSGIIAMMLPVDSIVNLRRALNANMAWRFASAAACALLALLFCPWWGVYGAAGATILGALVGLLGPIFTLRTVLFVPKVKTA